MEELIFYLTSIFFRRDKLYTNVDDLSTVKAIKEFLDVDVSLNRNQFSSKVVRMRTKAMVKHLTLVTEGMFSKLLISKSRQSNQNISADVYWSKKGAIKNDSGQLKYTQFISLTKCVLSISYRDRAPVIRLTKVYLIYTEAPLAITQS